MRKYNNAITTAASRSKARPVAKLMVLPPGELNGITQEKLPISAESFMTTAINVLP